ncbi:nucleoside hydrolase [Saccharolobus solfataricus]|uniref:Nucleoside hydrolase n=3 Tax=Saccharolobus solfataricus TaxID=2287 RepID=A0A0E3K7Y4_SACSO|nr:nucleoside hydrolase [Saccharolobus solfataricus]3T8J_A Chain A, Purine nucleosidase, (IunH-1) [Saccharolobus solfataricus P2]AAK40824.1 Purine nucleosidase, putative (iunH-1) [Saccharolobus solfataricus P2]AKA73799.1 nucleoside hydrolase [Saccharolobus solfataricus]AKA76496.1 nucleoside hydrolase [Saccharolobus solfataricus]AKA79189.1 nucleoside hydrolase [Saccharolobus solfataricus]AZF68275.1 nucleoside hydrolase [Saccharolobus solfataricus]
MRHFIIDCDTAEDDVLSLYLLLKNNIDVVAVTIVEGNISYEQEVKNALWALEQVNREIPVYPGANKPLLKNYITVEKVHGKGGIGDVTVEPKRLKAQEKHAALAIIDLANEYAGELEFLAISPLTNLALAYLLDNSIVKKIKKVWVMGGAVFGIGNITPVAEFNIWVDPDAAKIVFNAGFDITMIPWDVIINYPVTDEEWNVIKNMKTRMSELYVSMYLHYRQYSSTVQKINGHPHPDAITTAIAIDGSIATRREKRFVVIDNTDNITRGMTLVDRFDADTSWSDKPNAEIVYEINKKSFMEKIYDLLNWF